jgi:hypothetical protein
MRVKIDSELSWITPYLLKVKHIVKLNKLKTIKSSKYDKRVNRGAYASCRRRNNTYIIHLDKYYQSFTHHKDGSWSVKLKAHSKIDIL